MRIVNVLVFCSFASGCASTITIPVVNNAGVTENVPVARVEICPGDRKVFVPYDIDSCRSGYYASYMESVVLNGKQRPDQTIEQGIASLRENNPTLALPTFNPYLDERRASFTYFRHVMTTFCYEIIQDPCNQNLREQKQDFMLRFANNFFLESPETKLVEEFKKFKKELKENLFQFRVSKISEQDYIRANSRMTEALAELGKKFSSEQSKSTWQVELNLNEAEVRARKEAEESKGTLSALKTKMEQLEKELAALKCAAECPKLDLVVDALKITPNTGGKNGQPPNIAPAHNNSPAK